MVEVINFIHDLFNFMVKASIQKHDRITSWLK